MITLFIISLLFIVHDKIIMLMGTWRTTQENSATTTVVWDALG
jgi:NADH:ubiquinone oxidoreductase subunit 3 (subunit A)